MHADAETGAVASGFDRGLSAYCWPRDAIWVGVRSIGSGIHEIGRGVYQWLNKVRHRSTGRSCTGFKNTRSTACPNGRRRRSTRPRSYRGGSSGTTGRRATSTSSHSVWPMIEQACKVCCGDSGGHPGLRMLEDLNLISSAGSRDQHFGAFLYSNACVVAGLRAAARLAEKLGHDESNERVERLRRSHLERRDPADDRHQPGQGSGADRPGVRPVPERSPALEAARASGPRTRIFWSSIRPRWTSPPWLWRFPSGYCRPRTRGSCGPPRPSSAPTRRRRAIPNVLSRSIYEPRGLDLERRGRRFARRLEPGDLLDGTIPGRGRPRNRSGAVLDEVARALRRNHQPDLASRALTKIVRARSRIPAGRQPTPAEPPRTSTPR